MKVTFYKQPHGRTEVIDVKHINREDAEWFEKHGAAISMEDIGGMFAIYADIGITDPEGEPNEAIELSHGRSCEETMAALRIQCEEMLKREAA